MKNAFFAGALLISGTLLICENEGYLPIIGIGFTVLSFVIWLWKPIARLGKRIQDFYSRIYSDNNQE